MSPLGYRPLLAAALVGLGLFGGYVGPFLMDVNGFGATLLQKFHAKPHPGFWFAPQPFAVVREFSGVAALDDALSVLLGYFSALIDGDVEASHRLYSIWGMAQFAACWTLLSLEGSRAGNRGKLISLIAVMGLTVQVASVMLTVPLWLAWYLYSSPVSTSISQSSQSSLATIPMSLIMVEDAWELIAVPLVVAIVYGLPAVAMYLPPSLASAWVHYGAMAWWQPFPLWHVVLNAAIATMGRMLVGPLRAVPSTKPQKDGLPVASEAYETYLVYVNKVYGFATALGVTTQLPIVILALAPSAVRSALLAIGGSGLRAWLGLAASEDGSGEVEVSLWSIFVPASPTNYPTLALETQRSGEPAGPAVFFLQYDMYIGFGAALLWAVYLYQRTAKRPQTLTVLLRATGWFAAGGISAALASLLWDRDLAAREAEEKIHVE